jgi:hypothetical protein
MCKEVPINPVNRVVDLNIINNNRKKWRAEEGERQKGAADQKKHSNGAVYN